jgi:RimJ/RimL family protein N-acetyltransferase
MNQAVMLCCLLSSATVVRAADPWADFYDRYEYRSLRKEHLEELRGIFQNPQAEALTGDRHTEKNLRHFIIWSRCEPTELPKTWTAFSRGLFESGATSPIGAVLFYERLGDSAALGYYLHPSKWGQGVMSQAVGALVDVGFKQMGLRRITARVTPGNHRSCRVLFRNGFCYKGRRLVEQDQAWRDVFVLLRP